MTTPNEASNGTPETPEKETTPRRSSRAARGKRTTASGGLVKAEDHGAVIVLADNTRLVETDTLPNHRPIALSTFEIVGTLDRAGDRPIAANTFEVATTDLLPGHRPIAVSDLPISDLHVLPGDRPIAPNDVIDPPAAVLMGYLD
ncbi:MAG TPA: hypothetical protein IGR64_10645 [Leptolyngbyaceae cyanobacterium M65_K2018_010]|nr:hypothetical protein [Leptolyngbyaceae cyanobacterium M65_K2018_010]